MGRVLLYCVDGLGKHCFFFERLNHSTAVLFGALLTALVGLAAGWAIGDLVRRYRHGVEQLDALRQQLPQPYAAVLFQERQLREIRGVLNDLHKIFAPFQKASKNGPLKPHKITMPDGSQRDREEGSGYRG
jgi:hypothetical protein